MRFPGSLPQAALPALEMPALPVGAWPVSNDSDTGSRHAWPSWSNMGRAPALAQALGARFSSNRGFIGTIMDATNGIAGLDSLYMDIVQSLFHSSPETYTRLQMLRFTYRKRDYGSIAAAVWGKLVATQGKVFLHCLSATTRTHPNETAT
jgi:hypothetical protein